MNQQSEVQQDTVIASDISEIYLISHDTPIMKLVML